MTEPEQVAYEVLYRVGSLYASAEHPFTTTEYAMIDEALAAIRIALEEARDAGNPFVGFSVCRTERRKERQ